MQQSRLGAGSLGTLPLSGRARPLECTATCAEALQGWGRCNVGRSRNGARDSARSECFGRGDDGAFRVTIAWPRRQREIFRLWQRRVDNHCYANRAAVSAAELVLAVALVMSPAGSRSRGRSNSGLLTSARRGCPWCTCARSLFTCRWRSCWQRKCTPPALRRTVGVNPRCGPRRRPTSTGKTPRAEFAAMQGSLEVIVGELRVGVHPVCGIRYGLPRRRRRGGRSQCGGAASARRGADGAGLHSVARRSLMPAHWGRLAVAGNLPDHGLAIAAMMADRAR